MASDRPSSYEMQLTEHIDPGVTGDNIAAKKVAQYANDGNNSWQRLPLPLVDKGFDYIGFSNPNANGNYQTLGFYSGGSGGTLQRTLTLTYDVNNNVASIART